METFENLRKSLGYSDPCPHFYIPQITIGYFPMNEEELKWNTKPVLEIYLNEVPAAKINQRDERQCPQLKKQTRILK